MTRTKTRARTIGRILREVVLTLAALGGAACIVLAVLAYVGGWSLIMFKTGSMAPTITAGSVALVHQVPAADLAVGDIVTVDRDGTLPVTHRVTSIAPGAEPEERIITMRGDANDADDPLPYAITQARVAHAWVPHLAHVIVWFGHPAVLGLLTSACAALVTWAFWPRETPPEDPPPTSEGPQTRKALRAAGLLGVAIAVGMAPALTMPAPAAASDILTLRSDLSDTDAHVLDDSTPLLWHIDVDAQGAPVGGELEVSLSGAGDTKMTVRVEVRTCAVAWTSNGCGAGERLLRTAAPLVLDGEHDELLSEPTPAVQFLRLALTAVTSADVASAHSTVTVSATAAEVTAEQSLTPGELAPTGGASWALVAAPAAVLVGLGIALIASRRGSTK